MKKSTIAVICCVLILLTGCMLFPGALPSDDRETSGTSDTIGWERLYRVVQADNEIREALLEGAKAEGLPENTIKIFKPRGLPDGYRFQSVSTKETNVDFYFRSGTLVDRESMEVRGDNTPETDTYRPIAVSEAAAGMMGDTDTFDASAIIEADIFAAWSPGLYDVTSNTDTEPEQFVSMYDSVTSASGNSVETSPGTFVESFNYEPDEFVGMSSADTGAEESVSEYDFVTSISGNGVEVSPGDFEEPVTSSAGMPSEPQEEKEKIPAHFINNMVITWDCAGNGKEKLQQWIAAGNEDVEFQESGVSGYYYYENEGRVLTVCWEQDDYFFYMSLPCIQETLTITEFITQNPDLFDMEEVRLTVTP